MALSTPSVILARLGRPDPRHCRRGQAEFGPCGVGSEGLIPHPISATKEASGLDAQGRWSWMPGVSQVVIKWESTSGALDPRQQPSGALLPGISAPPCSTAESESAFSTRSSRSFMCTEQFEKPCIRIRTLQNRCWEGRPGKNLFLFSFWPCHQLARTEFPNQGLNP